MLIISRLLISLVLVIALWASCSAAPSISGYSGTMTHGQTVTINGSGFGTKSTAAPLVWDDCSGTSITTLWSGGWPNSGTTGYRLQYQTPIRGIALPHSNISKYMTGAHGDSSGAGEGYNVMFWRTFTGVSYPQYVYLSAYVRHDPNWVFGGDNNLKLYDFSNGGTPYTMNSSSDSNWYSEHNGRFSSATGSGEWHLNDDGGSLVSPDENNNSWWWGAASNLWQGWVKQEHELLITNQNTGYYRVYENGTLRVNYAGRTDNYTGTTKTVALGGYARSYGQPNNYRYFADIYMDTSPAKIMLCTGSSWSNRGLCEIQIPVSWGATSAQVTFNQGSFTSQSTPYLYVVDSDGAANSSGYAVEIGSSGAITGGSPINTGSSALLGSGSTRIYPVQ